jgi:hypothetical protein
LDTRHTLRYPLSFEQGIHVVANMVPLLFFKLEYWTVFVEKQTSFVGAILLVLPVATRCMYCVEGTPGDSLWFTWGFPVVHLGIPCGSPGDSLWFTWGFPVVHLGIPCGSPGDSLWLTWGFPVAHLTPNHHISSSYYYIN